MQAEKDELPVLPEPAKREYRFIPGCDIHIPDDLVSYFTTDQMHAYAREAVATATSKIAALQREVEGMRSASRPAPRFPTMLRKMWSGGEVQAWINEHWNAAQAENSAEMFQSDWRMRVATIAAECNDPDTQAALDKLLEDTP